MFHVHRSNRMEELAVALAGVVAEPLGSPFEPELVVVQSKGMERWLGLELGQRLGIWANARFPFPRAFLEELFAHVLEQPPETAAAWSRESLTWTIARLCSAVSSEPECEPLARYLADDPKGTRRFELAARLAHLFDQYAAYRPELVLDWDAGRPAAQAGWQRTLWREVVAAIGPHHLAARAARFTRRWRALTALPPGLPRRLSVFGLSALPPIYLGVLSAVAERLDVHLFSLSPSREFWALIRSKRELSGDARSGRREDALHLSEGNALLASLGQSGRDFSELLESSVDYVEADAARYVDPGTRTLLAALQSDILNLRLRSAAGAGHEQLAIEPGDRSVEIHCCHSPMREVEVLRDQLLCMFDEDASLEPHHVIVMMPDVDRYAPLIDAVFGVEPGSPLFIPYRIADKTERADSEVARALSALLDVLGGRMKASEVLDLLELEPIRRRFGIAAEEVARIRAWVHEAGVRWGVDARDRALFDQPAVGDNTWRFGLNRLLLGVAMPGNGERMFAGTLPYDDLEGEAAESVGRLAELVEALIAARARRSEPRTVAAWKRELGELLEATVRADDARAWQLRRVRELLAELAEEAEAAGFDEPIALEVMRQLVGERVGVERTTHDFLSGGVTFCALLPMRSIPFRVVALLGMSDDDFPRRDRAAAFDLMARHPRLGDRSLADEDRYMFLEALLAARDRFYVSYVGRNIQDDRARPPSVVVGDLLDAIDDGYRLRRPEPSTRPPGRRSRAKAVPAEQMALPLPPVATMPLDSRRPSEQIVIAHPLQPFSPRYFGADPDPRLVSHAVDEAAGARALVAQRTLLLPFVREPLPELGADAIDLDELARFFENPARGLLRRLGVDFDERPDLTSDREPIEPDALERYVAGQHLLERALAGDDLSRAEQLLRGRGLLPVGTPGSAWLGEIVPEVRQISRVFAHLRGGERLAPRLLSIQLESGSITGALTSLFPSSQLVCAYSRIKAKSLLALWIRHLALCASGAAPSSESALIGRPRGKGPAGAAIAHFRGLERENAARRLAELVEIYRIGNRQPLCLFPAVAERYVSKLTAKGDREAALAEARGVFESDHGFSEKLDPSVQRVFEGIDPFSDAISPSFTELAERVFRPLLAHLTEKGP